MRIAKICLVVLLLTCFVVPISHAQEVNRKLIIVDVQTTLQADNATSVQVWFTLSYGEGVEVQSAEIIAPEKRSESLSCDANAPIYLGLALDVSGSIRNDLDDVVNGAVTAIEEVPNGTLFYIIRFDEEIYDIQGGEFLSEADAKVEVRGLGEFEAKDGTRLYDAIFAVVNNVQKEALKVPRQRVVIAFTDGNDVKNIGDDEKYSDRTEIKVIEQANSAGQLTPIHTIGLGNEIAEDVLNDISQETGGVFLPTENAADLTSRFAEIIGGIAPTCLAQAAICTDAGEETGRLRVTLSDGSVMEASFPLSIEQDCLPPATATSEPQPTPLQLELSLVDVVLDNDTGILTSRLIAKNDENVERYGWRIKPISALIPVELADQKVTFTRPTGAMSYPFVAEFTADADGRYELEPGDYELYVIGFDANNDPIGSAIGNPFTYTVPDRTFPWWILWSLLLLLLLIGLWQLLKRRNPVDAPPNPLPDAAPVPLVPNFVAPIVGLRVNKSPGWPDPYEVLYIQRVPYVIGRNPKCDLPMTKDWRISKEHARIDYVNGQFTLEDLHSSNGTIVDGRRLNQGETVTLHPQTVIYLGPDTELEFEPSE